MSFKFETLQKKNLIGLQMSAQKGKRLIQIDTNEQQRSTT